MGAKTHNGAVGEHEMGISHARVPRAVGWQVFPKSMHGGNTKAIVTTMGEVEGGVGDAAVLGHPSHMVGHKISLLVATVW